MFSFNVFEVVFIFTLLIKFLKRQYLTSEFHCVCGCAACTAHAGTLLIFSIRLNVEHILLPFAAIIILECALHFADFCLHYHQREAIFAPLCCELLLYCENASWLPCIFHWMNKKQKSMLHSEGRLATNSWIEWKKKVLQRGSVENNWIKKKTFGKMTNLLQDWLWVFFFLCTFQSFNRSGCAHGSDCDSLYRQHYHPGVGCGPGSHRPLHGHIHILIWRHYRGEDQNWKYLLPILNVHARMHLNW